MYLGRQKASLKAADNGISASVSPVKDSHNLFVPNNWAEETETVTATAVETTVQESAQVVA